MSVSFWCLLNLHEWHYRDHGPEPYRHCERCGMNQCWHPDRLRQLRVPSGGEPGGYWQWEPAAWEPVGMVKP